MLFKTDGRGKPGPYIQNTTKNLSIPNGTKRLYTHFVVPPRFRVFQWIRYGFYHNMWVHPDGRDKSGPYINDTLFMTGNGVGPCTLLTRYRLARGIRFLLAGTLAVGGVASLIAIGKEHVSHKHNHYFLA